MAGFSDARKELSDAGNRKDVAMLNGLSIIAYLARNHWDAGAAVLATRYFYGEDDFGGLIDMFSSAVEGIA
jgi:hypothetical protein